MVSHKDRHGQRIVWLDAVLAEQLDAMGEKEGLTKRDNRYADMARVLLNRAAQIAEGAQ